MVIATTSYQPAPVQGFIEAQERPIIETIDKAISCLLPELLKVIAGYAVYQSIGPDEWAQQFPGINVDPHSQCAMNVSAVLGFWTSSDPHSPSQKVYETHYPPVFCPAVVREEGVDGVHAFSMARLKGMVDLKRDRSPAPHLYASPIEETLHFERLTHKKAGSAQWLILRKSLIDKEPNVPGSGIMPFLRAMCCPSKPSTPHPDEHPHIHQLLTAVYMNHLVYGQNLLSSLKISYCQEKVKVSGEVVSVVLGAFERNIGLCMMPSSSGLKHSRAVIWRFPA